MGRVYVIETVFTKNGVPVRLTDERWAHITEEHCELAGQRVEVLGCLEDPDRILAGNERRGTDGSKGNISWCEFGRYLS